ncbi:MAG: hypothetical protein QXD89_01055 [Candidatus Aenigmatarchaeota archaeon]
MKENLILPIFLLTLLSQVVVAQETDWGLISSFVSVIFILVFILILLAIGGVIHVRGTFSWFWLVFLGGIILLFVVPQFVPYPTYLEVPASFRAYPLPRFAAQFLEMLGLPSEWMYVPAVIYLFILPFAGIYTLVWAFLQTIKIFEGVSPNVNRVLAFVITFLTIPIGWFVKIVWIVFSFLGIWSVVIFGITFVLSLFFRGYSIVEKERYEAMGRRWRAEARKHLENALLDIKNKQAGGALNELNTAKNFAGFHTDYYKQIETAINSLNQTPPDYNAAEQAINKAKGYL